MRNTPEASEPTEHSSHTGQVRLQARITQERLKELCDIEQENLTMKASHTVVSIIYQRTTIEPYSVEEGIVDMFATMHIVQLMDNRQNYSEAQQAVETLATTLSNFVQSEIKT